MESPDAANAYIEKATASLAELSDKISCSLGISFDHANTVEIEEIIALEMGQGYGSRAMNILCSLADDMDITLVLGVANDDDGYFTADDMPDENQLIDFYSRFGFEIVQSMFDERTNMERTPN